MSVDTLFYNSPIPASITSGSIVKDVTHYPRQGLRGPDTEKLFRLKGIQWPALANQIVELEPGFKVMRLSATECWLLGNQNSQVNEVFSKVDKELSDPDEIFECYEFPCQYSHAWFVIEAEFKVEIFSRLCAVDLSSDAFPLGSVSQTSIARVSAIVAHHSHFIDQKKERSVFSVFCDISVSRYLYEELISAASRMQSE